MNTLKDIFVSYEIAEKLKEIGFDEECIAVYSEGKLHIFNPFEGIIQWVLFEGEVRIPTYEQVFKWFREKGIFCSIDKVDNVRETYYYCNTMNNNDLEYYDEDCFHQVRDRTFGKFETYEEAREQLILKLIEIYKNESI